MSRALPRPAGPAVGHLAPREHTGGPRAGPGPKAVAGSELPDLGPAPGPPCVHGGLLIAAFRDEEHNLVYIDREVRLTDGREWEEPAEDDVEDLFNQVYGRLDAGNDPTGLVMPGLKVKPGESPRFTLVLKNESRE